MKDIRFRIPLFFLFLALILASCEPPDDDVELDESTSTVFEEPFFPGFFRVNGEDITTTEVSATNYTIVDQVPASSLPDDNLFSFSIAVAIPTDSDVQIEPELSNVSFTREDGIIVPPFFEGLNVRENDVIDGVNYVLYDFNFTYPENAEGVIASTIKEFKVIVVTDYFDNSGNLLEDIIFNYTLNVTDN